MKVFERCSQQGDFYMISQTFSFEIMDFRDLIPTILIQFSNEFINDFTNLFSEFFHKKENKLLIGPKKFFLSLPVEKEISINIY